MSFLRKSFSSKSYFPEVWFAEADDSHLTDEEKDSGGLFAKALIRDKLDKDRIAFRRKELARLEAERQFEARIEAERKAKREAERLAESERVAKENERIAAIEAYRAISPVHQAPLSAVKRHELDEIAPELLQKLVAISDKPSPVVNAEPLSDVAPDYSDDIALIMILLEAA